MKQPITIGVLRGGPSTEYGVSLKTGGAVLNTLRTDPLFASYRIRDVFIDRSGTWHVDGVPKTPDRIVDHIDLFINALHGEYGEDGKVQQLLEQYAATYTGSTPLGAAVSWNKSLAKQQLAHTEGIRMPRHYIIPPYQEDFDGTPVQYGMREARQIFNELPPPWVVKPVAGGSSLGVYVAKDFDRLVEVLGEAAEHGQGMIVEELIVGREASCGVIDGFRGERQYALPATEIEPHGEKDFFDYFDKTDPAIDRLRTPGRFSRDESDALQQAARSVHGQLGLAHYSLSDFIIGKDNNIYLIETNALPGLTEQSIFPHGLSAVGSSLREFLDHLIVFAKEEK